VKEVIPERIDDDLLKRFENEFIILASLRHPNILQLLGGTFDIVNGEMCIVTEFCECGNLRDFLKRRGDKIVWGHHHIEPEEAGGPRRSNLFNRFYDGEQPVPKPTKHYSPGSPKGGGRNREGDESDAEATRKGHVRFAAR
jgi:hypothetical protein